MPNVAPVPIAIVIAQHVESAAALRALRTHLVSAPHVNLAHLSRLDERIAAHLDGVSVAGDFGTELAIAALDSPGMGVVFVAAIRAVENRESKHLDKLFSLSAASPAAHAGLTSAFGWHSAQTLKGTVSDLLVHAEPFRRSVAIAACAMHRVDPGAALDAASASSEAPLRARALRCGGEIGGRDLLPMCVEHIEDKDPACAFWAAWSATLLGDRGRAVESLRHLCLLPGVHQQRALQLLLKILNNHGARALLQALAQNPVNLRALIHGVGIAGDPFDAPWLIGQMADEKTARLAGEAFSFITGLDLQYLALDKGPPENPTAGPNDDPNDDHVDIDPDDGLPWPDQAKVQTWWSHHGAQFTPGVRHFIGSAPSHERCVDVLENGYQRQRIAAAQHLCLLNPGMPLFNTSAPSWRQRRLLARGLK